MLTQSREHLIERTYEAISGAPQAIVHLYNSTSTLQRRVVFGLDRPGIVDIAVKGSVGVPEQALELTLEARQASPGKPAREEGPFLSIDIRGPWNAPELTLDARSLISRSQAAEPLLRSLAPPADGPR